MLSKIYTWFETRIPAFPDTQPARPPDTLWAFYWYYLKPIWPIFIVLLAIGFVGSAIEVALMAWVGSLDLNHVGYVIVGLFVATWVVALVVWRVARIEDRWTANLRIDAG